MAEGGIGAGHGVGAAIDQAVEEHQAQAEGAADQVVQEMLFDDDDLGEDVTGALDAPSPMSQLFQPRKRGRPAGSQNRMTKTLASWLLSQHRHPVAVAMEAYSMSPVQLAERLGLAKGRVQVKVMGEPVLVQLEEYDNAVLLELAKLQFKMVEFSAKYVAQQQPQAVNVTGGADFTLNVLTGAGGVSFPARGEAAQDPEGGEPRFSLRLGSKSDG